MEFTFDFIKLLLVGIGLLSPLLIFFIAVIILLGRAAGRIEGWPPFDAFYWSFTTAFTVGYGDLYPSKRVTKTLAIVITLFGIMFTGVIVAITVKATTDAYKKDSERNNVDMKSESFIPKGIANGISA